MNEPFVLEERMAALRRSSKEFKDIADKCDIYLSILEQSIEDLARATKKMLDHCESTHAITDTIAAATPTQTTPQQPATINVGIMSNCGVIGEGAVVTGHHS